MERNRWIIIALAVIVAAAVLYYLISPAFIVIEKEEPLPEDFVMVDNIKVDKKMLMDEDIMKNIMPDIIMNESPLDSSLMEKRASFVASAHDVMGEALYIESSDKKYIRFENFETINGPDLHVYLSKDTNADNYYDLGKIKATKGSVNYEVPESVNVDDYNYVLVWCEPFRVLFSYAKFE